MEDKLKNWLKTIKLNESTISMFLGAMVIVVVGVLIYNYFTSTEQLVEVEDAVPGQVELVEEDGQIVPKGLPTEYEVQKGDHLWSIAESFYNSGFNWVDIAEANEIAWPDRIEEGVKLTIPKVAVKEATAEKVKEQSAVIEADEYTVAKGDTLWSIAVRTYQDGYKWPEIAEANKDVLVNPNIVEVGQTLKLPR